MLRDVQFRHGGHHGLDRMVVGFTTTYAISAYHQTGRWFSPGIPVSSTKKTDRHDIAEILLKVALSTVTPTPILNLDIQGTMCVQSRYSAI